MKRIAGILLILLLALTIMPVGAQDTNNTGTPVEISGTVESISGTTIVVSGLTVDISSLDSTVIAVLQPDMEITISGNLSGTTVIAINVVLPDDVLPEPEASPEPDDDSGITVQIFISVDGGTTWETPDDDDVDADEGEEVLVRFVVLNLSSGTVTGIDLTGTSLDISGCEIPTELAEGEDFDCTVTVVFVGGDDGLDIVVVVTGTVNGVVIIVANDVTVHEDEDDDDEEGVVIVIEGPVTAIVGNQITIFNFNIIVAEDDPMLTVIQIGDVIHIEGDWDDDSPVIIAIIIIFVDVDVFVFDGQVWRDPGNCAGGPPPWAPANGWRRRCEGGGGNGGGRGRGGSHKGSS